MIKNLLLLLALFLSCAGITDYSHIKVIKAIDGDTIKLGNGQNLRYIGLDAPEMRIKKNGRFIYAPQPFAIEATKLNQKLVENKYIRIEFDAEKTDKYGRLLGYCFLGNTFINAKLIEEGVAVLYTIPPNVKYVDTFAALQHKARQEKKGMWGACETIEAEKIPFYVNQIRTIKGKIKVTYQAKECIFLDFDTKSSGIARIVIFANSYSAFYDKGIDPLKFYTGKTVKVSAKIRQYEKYTQVIINTPEEITLQE